MEREEYAKKLIRDEVLEKAIKNDVSGIKEQFDMIVRDSEKLNIKPRFYITSVIYCACYVNFL